MKLITANPFQNTHTRKILRKKRKNPENETTRQGSEGKQRKKERQKIANVSKRRNSEITWKIVKNQRKKNCEMRWRVARNQKKKGSETNWMYLKEAKRKRYVTNLKIE